MMPKYNPFHLVKISPWPILASATSFLLLSSTLLFFHKKILLSLLIGLMTVFFSGFMWWRDIHRESSFEGSHSFQVVAGLKTGMLLFIFSEVFFFISFFWAFFHSSISPTVELGLVWPPKGINSFNPMSIPLLNTILLLSSGISVTWSHHSMLCSNFSSAKNSLAITFTLGLIFSTLQGLEYLQAPFCISDSSFGSSFFLATGFHGFHVLVGSIFLVVCFLRFDKFLNPSNHILGFECSAWYWHFVDVIWLFLYSTIYWWGA